MKPRSRTSDTSTPTDKQRSNRDSPKGALDFNSLSLLQGQMNWINNHQGNQLSSCVCCEMMSREGVKAKFENVLQQDVCQFTGRVSVSYA